MQQALYKLLMKCNNDIKMANQSINQSNQIYIAPYVASESEARDGRVFTFTVNNARTGIAQH